MLYAHTPPPGSDEWHPLDKHLIAVAEMARQFADAFDAGDLAYWLGLWHDLGKCNPKFQEYLVACHADPTQSRKGPDHKAAGTQLAVQHPQVSMLALLIQAHHGDMLHKTTFTYGDFVRGNDGTCRLHPHLARYIVATCRAND